MKLRKCSLLQRPRLVSGLRHGLEMPIRFATVYRDTYGERNNRAPLPLFRIEIHLFDRFPRSERERTSIERFHGIRRKIRGIVNVATSRVTIFTDMHSHRDFSKRRRFFARVQVTYMQVHDVFSSSSGFLRFFFFFVRLPDFRIILFVIVLINDAFYSRYF